MFRICEKEIHPLESKNLHLKFLNNLSLPVFTSARIEGDEGQAIRIGLIDPSSGQIVTSGPASSAKLEIFVVEGYFDSDSDWTAEDIRNNIVRERDGKKPLLSGNVFAVLNDGIGVMDEISFTDNSSWTRSRKFRLGVRMVDQFDFVKIREAITESFVVRDHRGECKYCLLVYSLTMCIIEPILELSCYSMVRKIWRKSCLSFSFLIYLQNS